MKKTDNDSRIQTTRRNSLKTLLGGAGLAAMEQTIPTKWIKPAISTAIVPTHAATSEYVRVSDFGAEGVPDSELANVFIEFSTINVPDGTEVVVTYSSDPNGIQEAGQNLNFFEGTIETEDSEGIGIPFWNEGPITSIEVFGTPIGSDLELEIAFEGGSGIPNYEMETTLT